MTLRKDFWKTTALADMTLEEWEALCDGCGICCLYKVEDEDSGEVDLTNIVCRFLDLECVRCQLYGERHSAVPTCIQLTPSNVAKLDWLPESCAYRLVLRGNPLPDWHYLESGDRESIHKAGKSVRGKVISETVETIDHLEDHVIEDLYHQEKN